MINAPLPHAAVSRQYPLQRQLSKFVAASLISLLALAAPGLRANEPKMSFKIPSVNIPLHIKGQELNIVASGAISMARKDHDLNEMNLSLTADLADLQKNIGPVLGAVLDKDSGCDAAAGAAERHAGGGASALRTLGLRETFRQ
jgi:hypothetical protein